MTIHRAYKTKLITNNAERAKFERCVEISHTVFNLALRDRIVMYEAGTPTTYANQKKRFNAVKDELFPYVREVPYTVMESAFRNVDTAYQHFFRRVKNGDTQKGFPKPKRKGSRQSFTVRGVKVESDRIRLPVMGWFRLAERGYIPQGTYTSEAVTISKDSSDWYVSIALEVESPKANGHNGTLGIDRGIKSLAVCSDGTTLENPRILDKYEKQLARLNRELARRKKGGENWKKTKAKINKLYAKIRRVRKHTQHDFSRQVTVNTMPETIVLEDLNVKGMVKNRHLAKAVSDASMGELGRQIEYKAGWYGIEVVKADRWYPSSKTCSNCGCVKDDLTLADRTFKCSDCGFEIDRDLNAARNLAALGTCEQRGIACGVEK